MKAAAGGGWLECYADSSENKRLVIQSQIKKSPKPPVETRLGVGSCVSKARCVSWMSSQAASFGIRVTLNATAIPVVEVIGPQVSRRFLVAQDMVNNHQHFVGQSQNSFLLAMPLVYWLLGIAVPKTGGNIHV